jgi:hypothetical protein
VRCGSEVVKLVSPGPVGAAKLDEDDEMAKVARRIEELEGNFMIKEVDDEEIKTSTSGKNGYDESWGKKKENVNLRNMEETLYSVRDRIRRDQNSKSVWIQAYFNSVRLERPVFPHVQYYLESVSEDFVTRIRLAGSPRQVCTLMYPFRSCLFSAVGSWVRT